MKHDLGNIKIHNRILLTVLSEQLCIAQGKETAQSSIYVSYLFHDYVQIKKFWNHT